MKLKVKGERLASKRFEEVLSVMRHWPEYQRTHVHEILRHVQYLNMQIENLEKELREVREISFLEEKRKIQERIPILDPPLPVSRSLQRIHEKKYTPRGERFYYLLETGGYKNYLNLNDKMTKEKMIELANEWAFMARRPKVNL